MRWSIPTLLVGVLAAPLLFVSSTARAQSNPCGKFQFDRYGELTCTVEVQGGCTAQCTPISFVAACDGSCTASASVECTGGCAVDCEAECTVNPGEFDCSVECEASCQADCDARCSAETDKASCVAHCGGSCTGRCDAECKVVPPSADCKAKCDAYCDASCQVDANIDCNVECYTDLKGGCTAQCQEPTGAIFCNGQYVDATDLESCAVYLAENFEVNIDFGAKCDGTGCEAVAACTACSTAQSASSPLNLSAIGAGALGLAAMIARRRRRS